MELLGTLNLALTQVSMVGGGHWGRSSGGQLLPHSASDGSVGAAQALPLHALGLSDLRCPRSSLGCRRRGGEGLSVGPQEKPEIHSPKGLVASCLQ